MLDQVSWNYISKDIGNKSYSWRVILTIKYWRSSYHWLQAANWSSIKTKFPRILITSHISEELFITIKYSGSDLGTLFVNQIVILIKGSCPSFQHIMQYMLKEITKTLVFSKISIDNSCIWPEYPIIPTYYLWSIWLKKIANKLAF